ncbi:MAG: hypothetical protein Q8M56_19005, partial [Desulfobacterales bacterium]|nr:hypothetical protein [Desulfobacterales bacterium]
MEARNFKKFLLVLSVIAVMLTLSGCAGTMSLEEAKKVSVEMSGISSFTLPPRRINDILSGLQTKGQFDKQIADHFQEKSKKQPPETDDDAISANFYYERGSASEQMGLIYDALSDLRKAFSHAEKTGSVSDRLLHQLGKAEMKCGSITRAIELLERTAGYGSANNVLTYAYLSVGDIESAIRAKDRVVKRYQSLLWEYPRATPQNTAWWRYHPAMAEAAI